MPENVGCKPVTGRFFFSPLLNHKTTELLYVRNFSKSEPLFGPSFPQFSSALGGGNPLSNKNGCPTKDFGHDE